MRGGEVERSYITLCQVLAVIEVIMVGESRMCGMMLYELHLPHVLLANRCRLCHFSHHQMFSRMLQAGPGIGNNMEEIKTKLKTGLNCLTRALSILKVTR